MKSRKSSFEREYLLQGLFWLCLFSLHVAYFLQFPQVNTSYLLAQLGLNYLFFILLTNLFFYFLVPVVLRKQWGLFILVTMTILMVFPLAKQYLDLWLMHSFGAKQFLLYGERVGLTALYTMRFIVYAFWIALAIFLHLLIDWFKTERKQMELSNQQLQSELAYLRSQVNPHFLFNTLNNIYALAYKNSEYTAEAVMKLSSMMRYMLYEATEERVPLEKEIENLHSFIALQKLRSKQQELVNFRIQGEIEDKEIAPLLLVPLVENAFKHGSFQRAPVHIELTAMPGQLHFRVKNYYQVQEQKDPVGGVGLLNIRRRLELLYPKKHRIDIHRTEEMFEVTLKIME